MDIAALRLVRKRTGNREVKKLKKAPLFIGLGAGLIILALWLSGLFEVYELGLYDARMNMRPRPDGHSDDIVILAVGDTTLRTMEEELGPWPWPRNVYGWITNQLFKYEVKSLAYDIIFAESDPRDGGALDDFFVGRIAEYKVFLASALQKSRAETYSEEEKKQNTERIQNYFVADATPLKDFLHQLDIYRNAYALDKKLIHGDGDAYDSMDAVLPIEEFMEPASGVGFTIIPPDRDGKNRRIPLVMRYEGDYYPSLHLLLACDLLGADFRKTEIHFGKAIYIQLPDGGKIEVPIDSLGRMLLNFYDERIQGYFNATLIEDYFLAFQCMEEGKDNIAPEDIADASKLLLECRNRLVLVGANAAGLTDIRAMPISKNYPLVGTVATAVQNIIDRRFLSKAPAAADATMIMAIALLIGCTGYWLGGIRFSIAAIGIIVAAGAFSIWMFTSRGVWLDMLHPLLSGGVTYSGVTLYVYLAERREKAAIKGIFGRVVDREVMEELIAHPEALALGGASREATVVFTDIKGFTALSERLQPEKVVEMLNEYFTEMVDIVFHNGGMLDKYIGDAMMLLFGLPKPYPTPDEGPRRAVRCAVQLQKRLLELQKPLLEQGMPVFRMRIGINTGEVVAGNIGSIKRLEYSVIGDTVNLASRMEANAPIGGVLISESTYRFVQDEVIVHKRKPLVVRGRTQPVNVYEVLEIKENSHEAHANA
jgi:adenylate cyclase